MVSNPLRFLSSGYFFRSFLFLAALVPVLFIPLHAVACTLDTQQPSVTICTPAPNATVASPLHVNAGSNSSPAATLMQIYLDGKKIYEIHAAQLDTDISTTAGAHRLTVQAYNGSYFKSTISITVSGSTAVTVSVSPASANVTIGQQQQFTATVSNSSDTSVTWSVDGING